jgi:hypothetical protein
MLRDEHPLGEDFFSKAKPIDPETQRILPEFPEVAWRSGIFDDYRKANQRATEASDAFHFASLWARSAAALGRRVHFHYGMKLYPNVYIVAFGTTGDRKTTATRQAAELGNGLKIISGGGSGEGLADEFSRVKPGEGALIHAEELSQILRPGRWDGSTLIPFLTQCFDCPERYEMKFRKSPVLLEQPTPSMLAGVTPEWFWRDFRVNDFQGGFGNRMFFFTGAPKPPLPVPESPDLGGISRSLAALSSIERCEARLDARGTALWEKFYRAWREDEQQRIRSPPQSCEEFSRTSSNWLCCTPQARAPCRKSSSTNSRRPFASDDMAKRARRNCCHYRTREPIRGKSWNGASWRLSPVRPA